MQKLYIFNNKITVAISLIAIIFTVVMPMNGFAADFGTSNANNNDNNNNLKDKDVIYISSVTNILQSDDKVLKVENVDENTTDQALFQTNLIRTNADGIEDIAFKNNLGSNFNNNIFSIAIVNNQKIIVGGDFDNFNGQTRRGLVMLNMNGKEDLNFNQNLGRGFNSYIIAVEPQKDGKIIVLGSFTTFNDKERKGIVRLNADGTEDVDFYNNLVKANLDVIDFTSSIFFILSQDNNQILIGAYNFLSEDSTIGHVYMINEDGSRDESFLVDIVNIFDSND